MTEVVVSVLDLVGTFVFALSGGAVALQRRLDVFGVAVLSLAAGLGGGVVRDVLLDVHPPTAMVDGQYAAVCLAAAGVVVLAPTGGRITRALHDGVGRIVNAVQVFDAVGLGLFAVVGVERGLAAGLGGGGALVSGVLTAVGGGIIRDVLAGRTPAVLHRDVYALAAAAGAAVVVAAELLALRDVPAAIVGGGVTTGLRFAAMHLDWHAPRPRSAARTEER